MKNVILVGVSFIVIFAVVLYMGDSNAGVRTRLGYDKAQVVGSEDVGYALLPGEWQRGDKGESLLSQTYFNVNTGSLLELASFEKYQLGKELSSSEESSRGKGIQTREDVVEYLQRYFKSLGRQNELFIKESRFNEMPALSLRMSFDEPFDQNYPYIMNGWVFEDNQGVLRYVLYESRLGYQLKDVDLLQATFRLIR